MKNFLTWILSLKLLIICVSLNILSPFTTADMKIAITKGTDASYPIAIIPFTFYNNPNANDINDINIATIISDDLRNSGKFNTIPVAYLPYQPTQVSDIIPMFWGKLGINTIVLGSINIDSDDNYIISYQLIDTSSNPALIILENQHSFKKKWLRYFAHVISNEIFEKLTGIKGSFCTHIAYVLHNIHNIKYPYELWISDYDGHNKISICRSKEPLMSPAFSPDGKKLAYVTFDSGHAELVIQVLNTKLIENIISFPNHNGAPAFSPDGKKLAFSSSKTGSLNLYVMDLLSKNIQQLTFNRYNNTEPSWFPDSKTLAYTSDQGGMPQVYKIDINNINNGSQRLSWLATSNQKPNVNIDGTFIIMVNRDKGNQNISKLNLLTGCEERLITDSFLSDTPSLSPNGIMMIYSAIVKKEKETNTEKVSFNCDNQDNDISVIELVSIDGKFKAHLTGFTGNIRFPVWSVS